LGAAPPEGASLVLPLDRFATEALEEANRSLRGESRLTDSRAISPTKCALSDSLPQRFLRPASKFQAPARKATTKRSHLTPISQVPLPQTLRPTSSDKLFLDVDSVPSSVTFSRQEIESLYASLLNEFRRNAETTQLFRAMFQECGLADPANPANFAFRDDADPALIGLSGVHIAQSLIRSLTDSAVTLGQLVAKFRRGSLANSNFSSSEQEQLAAWPLHHRDLFNPNWTEQFLEQKRHREADRTNRSLADFVAGQQARQTSSFSRSFSRQTPYKRSTRGRGLSSSRTSSSAVRDRTSRSRPTRPLARREEVSRDDRPQSASRSRGTGRTRGRARGPQTSSARGQPFR